MNVAKTFWTQNVNGIASQLQLVLVLLRTLREPLKCEYIHTHKKIYIKKKGLCVTIFFVKTIILLKPLIRGVLFYSMKTFL